MLRKLFFIGCGLLVFSCSQEKAGRFIKNQEEFNAAVSDARPGDELVIADGQYYDLELRFTGNGTPDKPIVLRAEEPGRVIISGESNLQISGEYLVVSGLVFRDGFTPTSEVISFKTSKDQLANNTRVTNCIIDNFNNPERFDSDTWVALYGKNNQFDHNSLLYKGNQGVTLAVKLSTGASRENSHIIEYNYFGPGQVLGSNGGETLRTGTSHYCRTYSNTIVRNNYFDRITTVSNITFVGSEGIRSNSKEFKKENIIARN